MVDECMRGTGSLAAPEGRWCWWWRCSPQSPCMCPIPQTRAFPPHTHAHARTPVTEARKFSLEYYGAYKVLTNLAGKRQYILYPCGGQPPAAADLADVPTLAGFERKAIPVPAQKVRAWGSGGSSAPLGRQRHMGMPRLI